MPPLPLRASLVFVALAIAAACAHDDRPLAPSAPPATTAVTGAPAKAADFTCTQVMGVSVTGDWFNAGFENGLDNARWQVKWRKKAFIELWADPNNEIWAVPIQSACGTNSNNPDRVIFTGVNWEQTATPWWEEQFAKVITNIRTKYPNVRRIDLLTMLRGPANQSCGNVMTVVQPFVDEAIAATVADNPGVVFAAPKVHAASCDVFVKGGPHFTDAGMATVGQLYTRYLPMDAAGCACKVKK